MPIQCIVGLRNPGTAYESTRHNVGEWLVAALTKRCHATLKPDKKMHGEWGNLTIVHAPCKALLPLTFMNHSGLCVRTFCQFFRIPAHELLVVHDDLDLIPGRIKFKQGGGHGGHNGLRDITQQLGSPDFYRLRIGIGHPGHKDQVVNYVLGKPSPSERQLMFEAIDRGIEAMPLILQTDVAAAMNALHGSH